MKFHWSWRSQTWKIRLRGPLTRVEAVHLPNLHEILALTRPARIEDTSVWKLTPNGIYSVESYFLSKSYSLNSGGVRCLFHKTIWKATILDKVCIFLWLALWNKLHTVDVLQKKRWNINANCSLCGSSSESISHLLTICSFARSIWSTLRVQLELNGLPSNLHDSWLTRRKKNHHLHGKAGNQLLASICSKI